MAWSKFITKTNTSTSTTFCNIIIVTHTTNNAIFHFTSLMKKNVVLKERCNMLSRCIIWINMSPCCCMLTFFISTTPHIRVTFHYTWTFITMWSCSHLESPFKISVMLSILLTLTCFISFIINCFTFRTNCMIIRFIL